MKLNKILALACALSLTFALAGCGGAAPAQENDAQSEAIAETVSAVSDTAEDAFASETTNDEYDLPLASEIMTVQEDIQSYLNVLSLSKAEMLEQLVYDGFSEEEAAAALDESGIDWNEQALLQAKTQMELLPDTTYAELIDQLEYQKFTHEEAAYAADNCGVNWN